MGIRVYIMFSFFYNYDYYINLELLETLLELLELLDILS